MKAKTFDKSFAEKYTFANLIVNLSWMVLTRFEMLSYTKLLTWGFRSTHIFDSNHLSSQALRPVAAKARIDRAAAIW